MTAHQLTRDEARRIAIRAQLLDADRPDDLLTVVDRLTFLQLDPTAAIAPSADLVAWSRLGTRTDPAHLQQALEHDRTLFEHRAGETEPPIAMVRPMATSACTSPTWPPGRDRSPAREWLEANDGFRRECSTCSRRRAAAVARHPRHARGAVGVDGLDERPQRHPDAGVPRLPRRDRRRRSSRPATPVGPGRARLPGRHAGRPRRRGRKIRNEKRLRSLGIARPEDAGDGARRRRRARRGRGHAGQWRVDPDATPRPFAGRTALLSPFDRLIHDRARTLDLFGFEYILEMYKPAAKRRWGYFALPVLHHDRLVGKLDAAADRKAGALASTRSTRTSASPRHRRRRRRRDRVARRVARPRGRAVADRRALRHEPVEAPEVVLDRQHLEPAKPASLA